MLRILAFNFLRFRRIAASHRISRLGVLVTVLILAALLLPHFASSQARTGTQLSSGTALYARALRLSHNADSSKNGGIVVSVTAFSASSAEEDIYSSADGINFTQISSITDPDFSGGLCCGTLYELPSKVGNLLAGTLLWSGSVGQSSTTQAMRIKVYESVDQGKTWTYLSNCASGATPGSTSGGLWEPQFTVAKDGALVCFYSDEQQPGHSQLIHQVRSYDGIHWQDSTFTVASNVQADRPGMAVVTKLPSGSYFMSYELCGPAACTVFYRTSADGWSWGDPTNVGTKVSTAAGQYFEHAPTNVWAPSAASSSGTILLVGQMMYESNNQISPGNGVTIFTNHSADGSGSWSTMPAPVQVPNAYDNYCPNYSSPLLPSVDGQSILEFASAYNGSTCMMYHAIGPILAGTLTPGSVKVTPASTSISTAQPVNVTVVVAGAVNGPTPTGTVTLASGSGYTSSVTALSNGSATIAIPANALTAGTVTLTASYSGDANYLSSTGTASLSVTPAVAPGFAINANNLTLKAGASSGNTTAITVTPLGGFTGNITLAAQITSSPAGAALDGPTLTFGSSNPVNITSASPATATLTIFTTAAGASGAQSQITNRPGGSCGAIYLGLSFFTLPFCIRARRFRRHSIFFLLVYATAFAGGFSGCGGNSGSSSTVAAQPGTLPGNYIIAITGMSANTSAVGSLTLTVQ